MSNISQLSSLNSKLRLGFTVPELSVVLAIFGILVGIIVINLTGAKEKANLASATSVLVTDLKGQQVKAMTGDTEGSGGASSYGLYFETNRYTLFKGTTYSSLNPTNFVVNLESPIEVRSVTFPSSQVIFSQISGEVSGITTGSDTMQLLNTLTNEVVTIRLNRFGALTYAN